MVKSRPWVARGAAAAAALLLLGATSAVAQQAPTPQDAWDFIVTPYLWGAGESGTARIGSVIPEQNVDASFSDVWSNLDLGAMGLFEARKDRWGILADVFYVQLSKTSQPLLDGALGSAQLKTDNTLAEVAGAYRAWQGESAWLDVLAGLRYLDLSANITLFSSKLLPQGRQDSGSADWVDGFIGVRARQSFAEKWSLLAYLDIGTGGSKYSYQAIAGIGWSASKTIGIELGYRLLAEDYDTSRLLYDIRTAGPYLGVAITF